MSAKKNQLAFVAIVLITISPYYNASKIFHEDAICDEVDACFAYCEVYVDGIAANPTRECCDNLLILNGRVKYIDNGVRKYCYCIEDFSNSHYHRPYLQSRIQNMSRICGIHRSFPISEHMDCSKL
ncbi:protein ARABIDOPSIS THALIANA ANTHER 7-like [Solanum stenotomum]|uniref:protein ARABIDOPSIS THALIANA ANTHER 7-like n=1 Tax=Solanum stenotomum TaxID=172797 RepID=UPI0020D092CF|nr:protein ARABIDOPSIS THALIANA ANTHER 7-like [Solanum stenotomum]